MTRLWDELQFSIVARKRTEEPGRLGDSILSLVFRRRRLKSFLLCLFLYAKQKTCSQRDRGTVAACGVEHKLCCLINSFELRDWFRSGKLEVNRVSLCLGAIVLSNMLCRRVLIPQMCFVFQFNAAIRI